MTKPETTYYKLKTQTLYFNGGTVFTFSAKHHYSNTLYSGSKYLLWEVYEPTKQELSRVIDTSKLVKLVMTHEPNYN